jgi:two-component system, NtrC family, sensor histidine kinase PilS
VRLIIWRLVISTFLLGWAAVIQFSAGPSAGLAPLFTLIAATFGLSALYAALLGRAEHEPLILHVQIALDAVAVAGFVWFTGGIVSYFASLFVLPILAGSAMLPRRGGLMVTGVSMALYGGLVLLQYETATPAWSVWAPGQALLLPADAVARYTVAANLVGFLAVGLLSGSLAERVRTADQRVADASVEIADLQAYSEHIINSLAAGLVTTDPSGLILTFNRAAQAITGHSFESVAGHNVADVLCVPTDFAAALAGGLDERESRRADYRYRRADGGEIDLGVSAKLLETSGGRTGLLVTFQDTTTMRRLERDARLQQRLAAVGEMAAGIAHEIRNPLASMSGSIQILRQELALNEEQTQLMDIVLRESERLDRTIRSFLDYARPQRFGVARVDLCAVLQYTALLLRNSAEVRESHTVEVDAPDTPVWCEADEGQVRQILWNLATNALKAMPDGGGLRMGARQEPGGTAALFVRDEGVGIPEDELDAIFQPFHGRFAQGSGLGMAIVHRIVSDYGGEIRVTSKVGVGTTVEIRLPARSAVEA